jgi:hypothetical protein
MGHHLRKLILTPTDNYYLLYEFMRILSYFADNLDTDIQKNLHTLDFTFACHQNNRTEQESGENQELVFGTGGKLLRTLRCLMSNLKGKCLKLNPWHKT